MLAPINKMSELFFQSSSVEVPHCRNNISMNDFCKHSDKLGVGRRGWGVTVSNHSDYWKSVCIIWSIQCVWGSSIKADDRLGHIITSYLTVLVTNIGELSSLSSSRSSERQRRLTSLVAPGSPPLVHFNGLEMWETFHTCIKMSQWKIAVYKTSLYLTRLHLNISPEDLNTEICAMMTPIRCKLYQLSEFS